MPLLGKFELTWVGKAESASLYSSCSVQRVNRLSRYTVTSSVVILWIICTINSKCVCVVLCLLDGSPTWTLRLFLSTQAYIIKPKMLHCTVLYCMCGGVKSAVGLWHWFLQNKGKSKNLKSLRALRRALLNKSLKYVQCSSVEFTVFDYTSVKGKGTLLSHH